MVVVVVVVVVVYRIGLPRSASGFRLVSDRRERRCQQPRAAGGFCVTSDSELHGRGSPDEQCTLEIYMCVFLLNKLPLCMCGVWEIDWNIDVLRNNIQMCIVRRA